MSKINLPDLPYPALSGPPGWPEWRSYDQHQMRDYAEQAVRQAISDREAVRDAALEDAASFLERNRSTWVSTRAAYEIRALKSHTAALSAQPQEPPCPLTSDSGHPT